MACDEGFAQGGRRQAGLDHYEGIVDALTGWHEGCRASRIFGVSCVKRAGRVVFGLSRTGMVLVGAGLARPGLARPGRGKPRPYADPEAHDRALAVPGARLLDPSGRGEAFRPRSGPYARWVNQHRRSRSRNTHTFRPDSSTTSK